MKLDKSIMFVKEYIEDTMGGNVTTTKDPESKMVTFEWVKNDKTLVRESMSYRFSFQDLEQTFGSPAILGKRFVYAYEKSKTFVKSEEPVEVAEVVEEKPKKASKKKIVEKEEVVEIPSKEEEFEFVEITFEEEN